MRKSRFGRTEEELPEAVRPRVGRLIEGLRRGMDYIERDGRYLFTEKTFEKLSVATPNEAAGAEPSSEGNSSPASPEGYLSSPSRYGTPPTLGGPNEKRVTVFQKVQNPRMLIARSAEDGTKNFHVEVGESENFVPGMPLNVVPHPRESAFWKLVGILPRSKGRW